MMHAREKSDSAIVARKPTNKAERSATEPAEAEIKGNANRHHFRSPIGVALSNSLRFILLLFNRH
jgi:hypothetical protein